MERADKEAEEQGLESAEYDTIYWHHPALASGKSAMSDDVGYDVFTMEDWDRLRSAASGGAAKL